MLDSHWVSTSLRVLFQCQTILSVDCCCHSMAGNFFSFFVGCGCRCLLWQGKDIGFSILWVVERRKANNESIPHNEVISGDSLAINNPPRAHQKLCINFIQKIISSIKFSEKIWLFDAGKVEDKPFNSVPKAVFSSPDSFSNRATSAKIFTCQWF